MCGRYTLSLTPKRVCELFEAAHVPPSPDPGLTLRPRYNVAPTQPVPVVRRSGAGGPREMAWVGWSFRPPGAGRGPLINARSEGIFGRGPFGKAMRTSRCLVPATGFVEWTREGKTRLPFLFEPPPGVEVWAFAGITQRYRRPDGGTEEGLAILTCGPNATLEMLHDRMPVILPPASWQAWTDPSFQSEPGLQALLQTLPDEDMVMRPVSTRINRVANDDPSCVEPREPEPETPAPVESPGKAKMASKQLGFDW